MPWDAKRDALREDEMMIDQLEENLTLENYAEHMGEINRLARSRDASCRIRLADLLCGFPNPHAKDTLLALTGGRLLSGTDQRHRFPVRISGRRYAGGGHAAVRLAASVGAGVCLYLRGNDRAFVGR